MKEVALNTLCICLLLALLVGVWPVMNHWLEQQEQRLLGHMTWREPLDNWI